MCDIKYDAGNIDYQINTMNNVMSHEYAHDSFVLWFAMVVLVIPGGLFTHITQGFILTVEGASGLILKDMGKTISSTVRIVGTFLWKYGIW